MDNTTLFYPLCTLFFLSSYLQSSASQEISLDSDKKKNKQTVGTGGAASPHASLVSFFMWWIPEEKHCLAK